MGGVMIPMMRREGYSADYAVNVTTHAALAGALMPTSHNMIIYAFAAQGASGMIDGRSIRGASIGDLMFAGLLPVTCLMVCMLVAAYWVAVKNGFPKGEHGAKVTPFPGWGAVLTSFVAAVPGLFVVVLILGCILAGASTATEAAGIAVTYSMVLTALIYRTLGWSKLMLAAAKAAKTTGVVLLLIGVCNMLQWQMAYLDLPDQMANLLLSATTNPWMMFFLVNVILFILGTFMDMASTILICTPLFLPLCIQMGMGPIQFGIVMLVNAALGLNTPPVGPTQFVGCAIAGISIDEVMKTIMPFYGALFACLAVVTYVPWFSTWIPTLLKGQQVY
jgi:tripartite ATP-independent transporter DctM subunit